MDEKGLPKDHSHVHFSQLYGMSDHITFNLAKAGFSVSKYLPFGPITDVIPYLMRRAQENSSVSGQTGRELALIKNELKRGKLKTRKKIETKIPVQKNTGIFISSLLFGQSYSYIGCIWQGFPFCGPPPSSTLLQAGGSFL